ncbi:MAG TPA: hypothetical protein PKI93_05295 [Alphaproteobacteria bacterium]|nr:hypothetical protein [Alphaproteobacteria bacterium]HNS43728.1 hypothetical protein [Alphaproteobacteria bacterium]
MSNIFYSKDGDKAQAYFLNNGQRGRDITSPKTLEALRTYFAYRLENAGLTGVTHNTYGNCPTNDLIQGAVRDLFKDAVTSINNEPVRVQVGMMHHPRCTSSGGVTGREAFNERWSKARMTGNFSQAPDI